MDDKDQTQIRPSDSSAGQTRSSDGRKRRADPPAPGQPVVPPSQPTSSPAEQDAGQAQARPTRQLTRPQLALPQPILFSEPEDDVLLEEQILLPPVRRQRLHRTRRWLRSRSGRVVIPLLALLIGLAAGLTSVIWYGLSGEGPLVTVIPAAQGNLVVEANKDFVSQIVRNNMVNAGLPGHVQNITVTLKHGDQMIIQGDDVYPVLFTSITRHFTVDIQPYVHTCILQVRITHADLSGIPVTTFVQSFQNTINQQLASKPVGMPSGFTYCAVGVSTEPGGMYITYQATPVTH